MIEAKTLAPDRKFTPERTLVEEFEISRITVRESLIRMEAEG